MTGYLYILQNRYIPNLVKIGFTQRDPETRAAELSGNTGVPGKFDIVFSWLVADVVDVEMRIHEELAAHRRTGEFFELTPEQAKLAVVNALKRWGVIGPDGLSFEERKVKELALAKENERQRKQEKVDFEMAMHSLIDELELREFQEGRKAYAATELKGFFSQFKSSDTPERRRALAEAVKSARGSLATDLDMPWLLSVPQFPITFAADVYFLIGRGRARLTSSETFATYRDSFRRPRSQRSRRPESIDLLTTIGDARIERMPSGVEVCASQGWKLLASIPGLRKPPHELVNISTGETIKNITPFSSKSGSGPNGFSGPHYGRRFSNEGQSGRIRSRIIENISRGSSNPTRDCTGP